MGLSSGPKCPGEGSVTLSRGLNRLLPLKVIGGAGCYSLLKLSVSVPLVQLRMPWLNAISMGRLRKFPTHCCCSPVSPVQPDAPRAMSVAVRALPVIVACALKGPHPVVTLSSSSPSTEASATLTLPEAIQGSSLPLVVPETLVYLVHGLDGRNAAHVCWGGVVMVGSGFELVDVAELVELGAGTAAPGPPVVSPHDVNSMPRNRNGTVCCHNQVRFIVLP